MKKIITNLLLIGILYFPLNPFFSNAYESKTKNKTEKIENSLKDKIPIEDSLKIKYLSLREVQSHISKLYIPIKDIPKNYIEKMTIIESGLNIFAINKRSKAKGLMQILEPTWEDTNSDVPYEKGVFNPRENLKTGIRYLRNLSFMISKEHPNWNNITAKEKSSQILAAYNWGIGNLEKNSWNLAKSPKETKNYIKFVTGHKLN